MLQVQVIVHQLMEMVALAVVVEVAEVFLV
jgi:hypothetical protein